MTPEEQLASMQPGLGSTYRVEDLLDPINGPFRDEVKEGLDAVRVRLDEVLRDTVGFSAAMVAEILAGWPTPQGDHFDIHASSIKRWRMKNLDSVEPRRPGPRRRNR